MNMEKKAESLEKVEMKVAEDIVRDADPLSGGGVARVDDQPETCAHANATVSEVMPGMHLDCPDCRREIGLGLKGVPKKEIDPLVQRVVDHLRTFDDGKVAIPTSVLVHGVLKDSKTGLPIVMASLRIAIVMKAGFPNADERK